VRKNPREAEDDADVEQEADIDAIAQCRVIKGPDQEQHRDGGDREPSGSNAVQCLRGEPCQEQPEDDKHAPLISRERAKHATLECQGRLRQIVGPIRSVPSQHEPHRQHKEDQACGQRAEKPLHPVDLPTSLGGKQAVGDQRPR
jgi:hypothetical protein